MSENPFVELYATSDEVISEVAGRDSIPDDTQRRERRDTRALARIESYTAEDLVLNAVRQLTDDMSNVWFRADGTAIVYNSAAARRLAERQYRNSSYQNPTDV